jgi:hypothetical protein
MTTTSGLWPLGSLESQRNEAQGARSAGHRHSSCEKYTASHFINGRALASSSVELLTYQLKNR